MPKFRPNEGRDGIGWPTSRGPTRVDPWKKVHSIQAVSPMEQCTASASVRRATPHARLAALGVKLRPLDVLAPLREELKVAQKAVKYTPFEKLTDCFIGSLAGA